MKLVRTTSKEGPDADSVWVSRSAGTLFCKYCRSVNRSLYPRPLDVVLLADPPRTWTIGEPFRVGISIYRADFAEIIRKAVPRFVAGRCLLPNGQVIRDYVTLYSDKAVLMRGDRETTTKVCKLCGSVWSDLVMINPGRPAYLLRHQLTGDLFYQGESSPDFMEDELVGCIDWHRFPDLEVLDVDTLDIPLDDRRLPGDPDWDSVSKGRDE